MALAAMIPMKSNASEPGSLDGVYAGLTLNGSQLDGDITDKSTSNKTDFDSNGLEAGIGFEAGLGRSFHGFYIGASYQYLDNGLGDADLDNSGNWAGKVEANKVWNASVIPGYYLTRNLLAYGRFGIGQIEVTTRSSSGSEDIDTVTYGLGMKYALTDMLAASVEYQRSTGDEVFGSNEWDVGSQSFLFGIQYRYCMMK
jgi:opacity protein-like surface antigen